MRSSRDVHEPGPGRPKQPLVSARRQEVDPVLLHIEPDRSDLLGGVHHQVGSVRVGDLGEITEMVPVAVPAGNRTDDDRGGLVVDSFLELGDIDAALAVPDYSLFHPVPGAQGEGKDRIVGQVVVDHVAPLPRVDHQREEPRTGAGVRHADDFFLFCADELGEQPVGCGDVVAPASPILIAEAVSIPFGEFAQSCLHEGGNETDPAVEEVLDLLCRRKQGA